MWWKTLALSSFAAGVLVSCRYLDSNANYIAEDLVWKKIKEEAPLHARQLVEQVAQHGALLDDVEVAQDLVDQRQLVRLRHRAHELLQHVGAAGPRFRLVIVVGVTNPKLRPRCWPVAAAPCGVGAGVLPSRPP